MFVTKKMSRQLHCADPAESAKSVYARMVELNVRHMPVVENGRLVGILSDRDLLLHAWSGRGYSFPEQLIAGDLMAMDVVVASASATLAEAAQKMLDAKIDALPIIGDGGFMIGIITATDMLNLVASDNKIKLCTEDANNIDQYCWDMPKDAI